RWLGRAPGAEDDPQHRGLEAEEEEEGEDRDPDVGVVGVLAVGRYRVGKDGGDAADVARAEKEREGGDACGREERASASNHKTEVYRRLESRPRRACSATR